MSPAPLKPKALEVDEVLPVRKRLRSPVKIHPPLMPLIDVMFTLMLFFLICASFRQEEGLIAATLPDRGGNENKDVVPTVEIPIDVRATGDEASGAVYTLFANMPGRARTFSDTKFDFTSGNPAPDPEPSNQLFRALEQYRDVNHLTPDSATVKIDAHRGVRWQFVVEAYNQAVRAKFKKIGFAPQP